MFVDRKSTRPNRYKITPENGEAYYVTIERADEPTEEGTAINAAALNRLLPKPMRAEVGQYLRISEVDENGNVLAVEAVYGDTLENASI